MCQPPLPTVTMVVREFYANLIANVLKKVWMRGLLVDFYAKSINEYITLSRLILKHMTGSKHPQTIPRFLGC